MTTTDDAQTARLLAAALDHDRFSHPGYLPWLYRDNPRGEAIEQNVDEDGRRIAHYAVLPTAFRTAEGSGRFIFSTNVATDPTVRRGGLFREMAEKVYAAATAWGAPGMVGVGNDQSTVVVVDRFGWRNLGPLPVRVCLPGAPSRGTTSHAVDASLLGSDDFARWTRDLDWVPVHDWTQSWDTEFVRWRLARPDGGYTLHVAGDALAVSVREKGPLGIPAAVLLKVWPRPGATLPVRANRFVTAACIAHRAPVCVYAGFNAHVKIVGVPAPRRLLPSPLNVVYKCLDETVAPAASFRVDTWEFLDMDAY